jgi:hypothetical protein
MRDVKPCFVEFAVGDMARFDTLCAAFAAVKHDKDADSWRAEEDWLEVFDDVALAHFWWPTAEERNAFWARWEAAPVPQRFADPSLQPPSWDFLSMIEAFQDGEYTLLACRLVEEDRARLEFDPEAYPYGGTGCFHMLIQAFGFRVIGEDAGTGFRML